MRGAADLYAELAEIVGEDGVRALRVAFAGCELYVPRVPGEHHPLTVALGPKAAIFCDYYHGTYIEFPVSAAKRQQVLDLHASGHSNAQIARMIWISERYVRLILAGARRADFDSRQTKLF